MIFQPNQLALKKRFPDLNDRSYRWLPQSCLYTVSDTRWKSWINDQGSLTERLCKLSKDNFHVEVLNEGWIAGHRLGTQTCGGKTNEPYWSRKVVLWGNNQPWVVAHSLVPASSLRSPLGIIKTLKNKPLGALLFTTPGMKRGEIEFTRTHTGWGRRSQFYLFNRPLLVAEYFLPALLKHDLDAYSL